MYNYLAVSLLAWQMLCSWENINGEAEKLLNCVQTPLGDYQASYTDDQCFCFDEVPEKICFHIQIYAFQKQTSKYQSWRTPDNFNSTIAPRNVAGIVLECHRNGAADFSKWEKKVEKSPKKSGCCKIFKFRSDLGAGHFPDGYYRPCEKLHIEQR